MSVDPSSRGWNEHRHLTPETSDTITRVRWSPDSNSYAIFPAHAQSATTAFVYLTAPAPFNGRPRLTLSASSDWSMVNATYSALAAITALVVVAWAANVVILQATSSGMTAGNMSGLFPNAPGAWLQLEYP